MDKIRDRILEKTGRDVMTRIEIMEDVEQYRKENVPMYSGNELLDRWKDLRNELELLIKIPESVNELPYDIRHELISTVKIDTFIDLIEKNAIDSDEKLNDKLGDMSMKLNDL